MRKYLLLLVAICSLNSCSQEKTASEPQSTNSSFRISKETLKDKIMGGWAGQTIGVTFGGPTEFRFNGTMIQDYTPIQWYDGYIKTTMENNPGLYDDIYMDLTFVDIFEKKGLDAPIEDFANAYANAEYKLWHANQVGRYNILNGIAAPASGDWVNNPHADCIDYQIESDFAGLMSPGMPNTASAISDKIGHIMNYGDGWYGGVYVGAMYTLAFVSDDIHYIVREALKTIPTESKYYQVINDVINWHQKYPNDWKQTWFEIERKYTEDIGCPDGVFVPFNIDATVNSAYVVLGLLYGDGDFTKTLEISTRAGQDSDCNPSTAGGILGTMVGYNKIPEYWKQALKEAESIQFKYTTLSLNDVYELGYKHAVANIERNGGKVEDNDIILALQQPTPVRLEQSFEGHFPVARTGIRKRITDEVSFDFEGVGFVLKGRVEGGDENPGYVAQIEVYLDEHLTETVALPASFTTRRHELAWKYKLPKQKHSVKIRLLNPQKSNSLFVDDVIIYSDKAENNQKQSG